MTNEKFKELLGAEETAKHTEEELESLHLLMHQLTDRIAREIVRDHSSEQAEADALYEAAQASNPDSLYFTGAAKETVQ